MEFSRNPFRYGADFGPDDIVGRKDEIARVETVIREGRRLFLNGPRGFGKTSILRAAQAHMSHNGAIVLYVAHCTQFRHPVQGYAATQYKVMPPPVTARCRRSKRIIRAEGVLSKSKLLKCMVRRVNAREKFRMKKSLRKCIRPVCGEQSPGHDEIRRVPVLQNASAV